MSGGAGTSGAQSATHGAGGALGVAESLAWALLVVLLVSWKMLPAWTGLSSPDGVQYLSVAASLLGGEGPATSVIYFDAERSLGVLPAPLVTFPPGYSLAVAAAGLTALPLERAALLVSLLAMAATLLLLRGACNALGLSTWLSRGVLAVFALNALSLQLSASMVSESLFTAVATSGILFLLMALRDGRDSRRLLTLGAAAGLAFGTAYWIRYAGLFFVVGLGGTVVVASVLRRPRIVLAAAAAFVIAALLAGAGMLRNELLVGNWRGGNSKAVSNPAMAVLKKTMQTMDDLAFGSAPISANLLPRAIFLGLLAAALVMLWRAWRARPAPRPAPLADPRLDAVLTMLLLLGAYCAAMVYAGLFTVISYGSRMFAPVLPLTLLLMAAAITLLAGRETLDAGRFRKGRLLMGLALLPYAWLNLGWFVVDPLPQGPPPSAARFDIAGAPSGESPRQAIHRLLGEDGVLVATDGQMTGYALGVRTVALAGTRYTEVTWTEPAVREVMARYGARALALSAAVADVDPVDALPSPFLQALFEGRTPGWLEEVTRTGSVVVLRPRLPPSSQPRSSATISAK